MRKRYYSVLIVGVVIFLWLVNFLTSTVEVLIYVDDVRPSYPLEDLMEIEDVIESHNARAIYFVTPDPGVIDKQGFVEILLGKEIGLHGLEHKRGEFETGFDDAYERIEEGRTRLREVGLEPRYFKAPWNDITSEAKRAVIDSNMVLIHPITDYDYMWYRDSIHPWYEFGLLDLYSDKELKLTIHEHAINHGRGLEILDRLLTKVDSLKKGST